MIHNEMSFLFGEIPIPGTPSDYVRTVVNAMSGNTQDIYGKRYNSDKYERVYKDKTYGNKVIQYIGEVIYPSDRVGKDPYVSLIDYFNGTGGQGGDTKHGSPAMTLKAADFVYLTDLGVYPINRLIILRRYRDGVIVPANLSLFKEKPISTVIGWLKMEDNKEIFSLNFNEKWVEQTDTLDKVIQKIMKEQFGIKTEMFLPVPGWSQGFLFGMLNNMGLTKEFDSKNVPTGDPNVLRTAMMREVESQSLLSELKLSFETSYEQKYIDGVDPGLAFQDILSNLISMGTSNMKFILNGDSEALNTLSTAVLGGANGGTQAWIKFGETLIDAFINTIGNFFSGGGDSKNGDGVSGQFGAGKTLSEEQEKNNKDNEAKEQQIKKLEEERDKFKIDNKIQEAQKKQDEIDRLKGKTSTGDGLLSFKIGIETFEKLKKTLDGSIRTILAGSVYRYRWPLIGSIGLMSGLATTPWHLTVGNPFSPILNINNIVVSNVDLKFSNELGFNDMPKKVDATIDIKFGRPLGGQEINRMFNNQYGRIYSNPELSGWGVQPKKETEIKG